MILKWCHVSALMGGTLEPDVAVMSPSVAPNRREAAKATGSVVRRGVSRSPDGTLVKALNPETSWIITDRIF